MATQKRNGWKIFGIIVIAAVIVVLAFLLGRGCEKKKDDTSTSTSTTRTQTPAAAPASSGDDMAPSQSAGTTSTPTVPVEEGLPTVVSVHDEVGPCIGGFQDVTHTTTYSDGTSASSIARQPCGIAPVPEP